MLWILSTMKIYSFVWITMNNSLRILTLKTIEIYQVPLIEKMKFKSDDNNGLMWFNKETVEVLGKLYESFEKQISLDEAYNYPVLSSIGDIADALKLVQNISPTGQLWLQFMDFALIIRMFVLNGQVILNCISLHWNKYCLI